MWGRVNPPRNSRGNRKEGLFIQVPGARIVLSLSPQLFTDQKVTEVDLSKESTTGGEMKHTVL